MWKKLLSIVALVAMLGTQTSFAETSPVKSLTVSPSTINTSLDEVTTVRLEVTEASVVTVKLLNPSTSRAIYTFDSSIKLDSTNSYTYTKRFNGQLSDGTTLANGTYEIDAAVYTVSGRVAINDYVDLTITSGGSNDDDDDNDDTDTGDCELSHSAGVIEDAEVDPCEWDPTDEDLAIDWTLDDDNVDFTLTAEKSGNADIELMDDTLDADDFSEEWDGTDEDGDLIEEGTWNIVFRADGDTVSIPVEVTYEAPSISDDMFVTKTSFDNEIDEFTYVVFKLEDDAVVSVDVKDGDNNKKIVNLMDEEELDSDVWYAVKWDGMDDDDDEVDEGDYYFRVTASSDSDNEVESYMDSENVEVKEDDVSSSRSNVTNDYLDPVVIEKDGSDAEITYTIDEDADVTVAIYKDSNSSGAEIVLEDDVEKNEGTYTVRWDGLDEDGKKLKKDTKYSYLITSKYDGSSSKTDKERGYFVVGSQGNDGDNKVTPRDGDCTNTGFWDVPTTSPYCAAIAWAGRSGIFGGYPDGAFRQYNFINRAETLKVVLRAFALPILADTYTNLGFTDVQVGAWYMPYFRTGKFYGMISGYAGTTLVKPSLEISRVEVLKYVVEAAEASQDYQVPPCDSVYYSDAQPGVWYSDYICLAHDYELFNTYSGYFYPGSKVTRGEVALVLYRLYQAGLLK